MVNKPDSNKARLKRHKRVRAKISGTPECPRLNVFRSARHIYAQIIDDLSGTTLAAASTMDKDSAHKVGEAVAKKAMEKGITKVVFDRSGYIYHGRVKELAEGAREGGLKF